MPPFRPGETFVTEISVITVDAGLLPGQYRFQLVVEDNERNKSTPDEAVVQVLPRRIVMPGPFRGIVERLRRGIIGDG